jgi:hypothetical protein
MPRNLLVAVLGNRNAGKSTTWYTLFDRTVRTGKDLKRLYLNNTEWVDVFLVSGSPEERQEYVGDLITVDNPRIVLCSLQYKEDVWQSLRYFIERDYFIFLHWLNPGHDDAAAYPDSLGLMNRLLEERSLIGKRDGKLAVGSRVREIKDFIYGWAQSRDLLGPK